MAIIIIYLISLFIAPQLWVDPFIGWHPDLVIYGLWILLVLLGGDTRRFRPITVQDLFFLLMIVWIVLSSAVKGFRPHSPDIIANYLKYFLLYKLIAASTGTVERLRTVELLLVFFALILSVEGIQHMHSSNGLGWAGQKLGWIDPDAIKQGVSGRTQWINIFDGPGVFCVVYTMAIPFLLPYLSAPFNWIGKVFGILLIMPIAVAIYYTGSRGGILATLGVMSIYFAVRRGISPIKIGMAVAIGLLLFMIAPAYITTMNDQSHSATHRVDMWAEGVEMVRYNPVFGIGKGNFLGYTGLLIAHNSSVEIMGETGLVGLFLWAGLIYVSLKNVISYVQVEKNEVNKSAVMALGLSVTGYLISSMFVTLEYETFYFLLGLCAVPGRLLPKAVPFTKKDVVLLSGMCIGWVVLLKIFVMSFK